MSAEWIYHYSAVRRRMTEPIGVVDHFDGIMALAYEIRDEMDYKALKLRICGDGDADKLAITSLSLLSRGAP